MARRFVPAWHSVRLRTTLAAVGVVGTILVLAAIGFVVALRQSMLADLQRSAELRAGELAAMLESGTSADRLLPPGGSLRAARDDDSVIQIVGPSGRVLAASAGLAGDPLVIDLRPGTSRRIESTPVEDDPFLLVAESADTADGALTVLVGRAIDDVDDWTATAAGLLSVGVPLLVLVVGLTTWRVVGRSLAPVETMRREVEAISVAELDRRVPTLASDDEIARLAHTMNLMLDRLEQSVAKQRQFVSDASHELRSPVAAIRQHAEVTLAHPERASMTEFADLVLGENLRVQRLVDDLLLLSRVDEHALPLSHRVVDLDDAVFEVVRAMRPRAAPEIDVSLVSGGRVLGDESQLRRIVGNLVDNAVRHAKGRVVLTAHESGDGSTVLAVADDGPGIPEDQRGRVFERFVRLDDARARQSGGSGLGLAIVAELVAIHDGYVEITASPLGGARVEVRFPTPP